ncbi:acyl-coenzyme A thioesterase 13-like [Periplaneta americana]|uniref:acyl-coenzyme A thioesterase 13-like n=1 Tax=Periplaneta americana TaxID=6978 RepID=UPI0037E79B2E
MSRNGLKFMESLFKKLVTAKDIDRVLENVKITNVGEGSLQAELLLAPEHQNKRGTLHGGMTATLVDMLSTMALMTHEVGVPGVTVDLHISYLKTATTGETVVIDCNTLKAGKSLAFLDIELKMKETGKLIAKASHTKHIGSV